jgi:hypothetical protein
MHQEINKLTNSLKNPPSFSQCLLGIFHETVMGLDVEVTEVMKQGKAGSPFGTWHCLASVYNHLGLNSLRGQGTGF